MSASKSWCRGEGGTFTAKRVSTQNTYRHEEEPEDYQRGLATNGVISILEELNVVSIAAMGFQWLKISNGSRFSMAQAFQWLKISNGP